MWASLYCHKYLTSGELSHGGESGILFKRSKCCIFSIPSDGTICGSTNALYATSAAVLVPSTTSPYGHVDALSSIADAAVSSKLGGTSRISIRQVIVLVHDRLGPSQSDPEIRVGQHSNWSDRPGDPVRPIEQQAGQEFTS
jgi:hypothetical protein